MKRAIVSSVLLVTLALFLLGCGAATIVPPSPTAFPQPAAATAHPGFQISSPAFADGGQIPIEYTCFGENASPALAWSGMPAGAQSLVLLVTDPDAGPRLGASTEEGFAHWIVYDIPPGTSGFARDRPAGDTLADGARQGRNDFGASAQPGDVLPGGAPLKILGYDGPCPPGEHHYDFTLYALDTSLGLAAEAQMAQVLAAMEGHVLAQAQVVGLFAPPQ